MKHASFSAVHGGGKRWASCLIARLILVSVIKPADLIAVAPRAISVGLLNTLKRSVRWRRHGRSTATICSHWKANDRIARPQALTRKNALFAGHDDGAENWAILASLIETCKLNGIEPQAYLADVLVRLVNLWPNNRRDELPPPPPRASNSSAPLNRSPAPHSYNKIKPVPKGCQRIAYLAADRTAA